METHTKLKPEHLKRRAYLYVRQSTMHQVKEHTESAKRQYALRRRLCGLGWPGDRIVVIDADQGESGATAESREGFQRLVADISMGRAGIVAGIEVSRLARNCADWHRLMEICGLSDTLIMDEDGIYDPHHYNDRLLLGLKATMGEAELHIMKARLLGGLRNKAKRGELRLPVPVGLVYRTDKDVHPALDPDRQVQQALRCLFRTYRRTGSAFGVVRHFREQGMLFPRRIRVGPGKGTLVWAPLGHCLTLSVLHNPRYAGAFAFGRSRARKSLEGKTRTERLPQSQWNTLIPDVHEGYISWTEFNENERRLKAATPSGPRNPAFGPPREGPALLQGLVICGVCGARMTVRYHQNKSHVTPVYQCAHNATREATGVVCQWVSGRGIDATVSRIVLEVMTPLSIETALAVQREIRSNVEEADRLREQQVERVQYEAELAHERFLRVDPRNRFVADELEADWNEKLRQLNEAREERERMRASDRLNVSEEVTQRIRELTADFASLWKADRTTQRDRKRIVRHVIEDVTLRRDESIVMNIRFKGGATRTETVPLPKSYVEMIRTPAAVIERIDQLIENNPYANVAAILNEEGFRSGAGRPFTAHRISYLRNRYSLKGYDQRQRDKGLLTRSEMAKLLKVSKRTVEEWERQGLLHAHRRAKNTVRYEHPGPNPPTSQRGVRFAKRRPLTEKCIDQT